jgi:predicted CXXCH cytochrome family protein
MRKQTLCISTVPVLFFIIISTSMVLNSRAFAAEPLCLKCHAKLTIGKSVHKALNMGCGTCHSGIDATTVPHKKTNALEKGLSSAQPGLCYGCHDKAIFTGKIIHPAISTGCTVCHNPHSSKYVKLLTSDPKTLCLSCHDKAEFTKKNIHSPVASGDCTSCHSPHSSDQMALLLKKPFDVCLQCHPSSSHGQHIRTPQQQKNNQGTTISQETTSEEAEPQDPLRPGKPFYCGSCHNPHSTNTPLLFRFNAQSVGELCKNCHKMN